MTSSSTTASSNKAGCSACASSPQPPIDNFFPEGRCLEFGDNVVDVFHTPGHSPGGVCLAIGPTIKSERELFVGDTLFSGSIGRTDLPAGDMDTLLNSIRTVLFRFPDDTLVHSGHGPTTTIGEEKRGNPFLRIATDILAGQKSTALTSVSLIRAVLEGCGRV